MGKIKKIVDSASFSDSQYIDIYPVTSTKAVYNENNKRLDNILEESQNKLSELELEQIQGGVYDISAHNNNAVFESLQALLNSSNLSTLIPMSVRHGGMSIRFIQSPANKYVQWRLVSKYWNTDVNNWVAENEDFRNRVMQEVNTAVASIKPIEVTGDVTNAPDEEDLTSINVGGTDVLKFKDKQYTPLTYSGMGRKILRKNIVDGVNTLTQSMVSDANTIYVIQYNFDLRGTTIEVPEKCVLEFNGGSLDNGVLFGNKTSIVAGSYKIFGDNLALFKYGYIQTGWGGYIDHAMIPLEYIVENGVMNINKVQPDTQLFSKYNFTEKLVTDGYERASNENDNGVITPIGESLDVRTDLVICPKQKATFSNNKAIVVFQSTTPNTTSLNGHQGIHLYSSEGIFTVPTTTHYLFFDGNGNLLHPGDTHADNDVYVSYMSKLIPLVSQSTFVGKAKLSWFVGDAYVKHLEDINNNAPDATLQFQKAMLSNFDIESDVEGYIRIEDSIYFETSKVVDFGGSYYSDSGVRQYNSIGNTHADRNYSQKIIVYTLSANKPLVYIRNLSIKLIGGKFTAEYSSNHAAEICIFDTDYPISGARFDGVVFCGKTAADDSLSSTCGIKFLPRGQAGAAGYCYGSKLDVSIYNCQYGISFDGSVNSMDIDLRVNGFYKTLVGSVSMCNINMIAQTQKCLPKSLADGLLCDVYISGGTMDGFFWDLGTESQTSDIITPYGQGKISGSCQLIGKSIFQNFNQWIIPNTIIDKYTIDTASIPLSTSAPWRNGCISVSKFIKSNINTDTSYAKVYKKTDGFQNSLQPTTAEAVRNYSLTMSSFIFNCSNYGGYLPQIDDDEYLEMVFYPSSTGYFLSTVTRLKNFTIVISNLGGVKNTQIIIDNSLTALCTTTRTADFQAPSSIETKISSIIVRFWGKTGSNALLPKIFLWDYYNNVYTTRVGINDNYEVYNNGNFLKYIDGTNIGEAAISNLNIESDAALTDKINSLNTLNSSPVLISKQSEGILWLYKNNRLFNLDGTRATLVHVGSTTKRPEHTIDNKPLTKGTIYRDTDICKTIIWDGNKWVEEDGAVPGVKRSGTFSNKPAAADIYVGFKYFCTDKQTVEGAVDGIEIIHKGNDVWVDALGRVVS